MSKHLLAFCCLSILAIVGPPARSTGPPTTAESIRTGVGASLNGLQLFAPGDPWNQDISRLPVDPHSAAIIASIGAGKSLHPDFGTVYNGLPWGIPYLVVDRTQAAFSVPIIQYADESDHGHYPIPLAAPVEGGPESKGDRHLLVLDKDNWIVYELWHAEHTPDGQGWHAGSGAIFDLHKPSDQRTRGWTSADAAGLCVLAGLARYDEIVEAKRLTHALRFTVQKSRRAYVYPAGHFASHATSAALPPMGMRVRLKASYDISKFPPTARVILAGLKVYGMILADNGGDWFISGAPNDHWDDADIETLKRVKGSDLEVVEMEKLVTR